MRNISLKNWGLPVAIALGITATPALADVYVYADIYKDKDVYVTETITKDKNVLVDVDFDKPLYEAAEAMAIVNVTNYGNEVGSAGAEENFGLNLTATIEDSVLTNTGVVHFNQDVGNMVNQGNVLALSSVGTPEEAAVGAFTDSQAEVEQNNYDNYVEWQEYLEIDEQGNLVPDKVASITNSITGNSGVVGVNQNSGNMNNQTNAVALSVGFGGTLALSEAALGQENSDNFIHEVETVKIDEILNSVSANTGVVSVNQSTGDRKSVV